MRIDHCLDCTKQRTHAGTFACVTSVIIENGKIERPDMRMLAKNSCDFKDDAYIIMEGHIYTSEDAIKCIFIGAHSVVAGSAVTI